MQLVELVNVAGYNGYLRGDSELSTGHEITLWDHYVEYWSRPGQRVHVQIYDKLGLKYWT